MEYPDRRPLASILSSHETGLYDPSLRILVTLRRPTAVSDLRRFVGTVEKIAKRRKGQETQGVNFPAPIAIPGKRLPLVCLPCTGNVASYPFSRERIP